MSILLSSYEDLVQRNRDKSWPSPLPMTFLLQPRIEDLPLRPEQFIEWHDFAPCTPKVVVVGCKATAGPERKRYVRKVGAPWVKPVEGVASCSAAASSVVAPQAVRKSRVRIRTGHPNPPTTPEEKKIWHSLARGALRIGGLVYAKTARISGQQSRTYMKCGMHI